MCIGKCLGVADLLTKHAKEALDESYGSSWCRADLKVGVRKAYNVRFVRDVKGVLYKRS